MNRLEQGVTIPSQRRYIRYFWRLLTTNDRKLLPERSVRLIRIVVTTIPNVRARGKGWGGGIAVVDLSQVRLLAHCPRACTCFLQFDAGQSCQPYFNVYENNIFRYTSKPSEGIVPTFKRQLHTNMAYVAGL